MRHNKIDWLELISGVLVALIIIAGVIFCFNRSFVRDNYILSGQYDKDLTETGFYLDK